MPLVVRMLATSSGLFQEVNAVGDMRRGVIGMEQFFRCFRTEFGEAVADEVVGEAVEIAEVFGGVFVF